MWANTGGQTKKIKTSSLQRGSLHGEMIKGCRTTKAIEMLAEFQHARPSRETKTKKNREKKIGLRGES